MLLKDAWLLLVRKNRKQCPTPRTATIHPEKMGAKSGWALVCVILPAVVGQRNVECARCGVPHYNVWVHRARYAAERDQTTAWEVVSEAISALVCVGRKRIKRQRTRSDWGRA